MRKLIAAINLTLDGFCDHTAAIVDDELHEIANDLLKEGSMIVFGRVTYQLMEDGWPPILTNPTGHKSVDEFAQLIDDIPKLVISNTLQKVTWRNTTLATEELGETITKLKSEPGKPILVGSPSLISQLTNLRLIDEYRLSIHPIILGHALPLFRDITSRVNLKLVHLKQQKSGVVVGRYYAAL